MVEGARFLSRGYAGRFCLGLHSIRLFDNPMAEKLNPDSAAEGRSAQALRENNGPEPLSGAGLQCIESSLETKRNSVPSTK